ncbi:hypothetical protein MMC34_008057 [Xylographa carneopallida]|nr:hypothetical protein [Xylographa carneopallida]
MDTTAYLTNQGWLGLGHVLQPTGRGIKKPLLVSKKSNVLGIGKKKHDAHADQWWARAFDNSLRGLEVSNNRTTGVTESVKFRPWEASGMVKAGGEKSAGNGSLYAGFVRGEGLTGTIVPDTSATDESGLRITKEPEVAGIGERLSETGMRTLEEQKSARATAGRLSRGKAVSTMTQVDSNNGKMKEVFRTTTKNPSSNEERRERHERHEERTLKKAKGAAIVQSVVFPNLADSPKRTRIKDKAAVLGMPGAFTATDSPENKNCRRDNPASTLSKYRVEKKHKKSRKADLQ